MSGFSTVQQHVHPADPKHGAVEVVAVEQTAVEVLALRRVVEHLGELLAQVFPGVHQEARGAAGGIADSVLGRRGRERHHELDDVARRAELPVLAGRGDLAQHVLIQIAFGVAVVHGHLVQQVDHLPQQVWGGNGEPRSLHVLGVGGVVAAQRAQVGEYVLGDHRVHVAGLEVLEPRPTQVVVGTPSGIFPFGVDPALHGLLQTRGLVLLQGVQVVQTPQKEQVGDLLQNLHGVGDAARPKRVPDAVDLALDGSGDHASPSALPRWSWCGCASRRER